MNKFSKFIKVAITYFIGNVLSKLLAFLLIPLYTSYISTETYGTYDLIVSLMSLIVPILFFQIWDGLFRFIYDFEKEKDKYKILNNGLSVCFISIVLYEILFFVINQFVDIPNKWLVNIYGLSIAFQYVYGTAARTFKKNKLYMTTGVINTFVNLGLNILLIAILDYKNANALYLSVIIGNLVQCLIISFNLKIFRNFRIKNISKKIIVDMVKFSMPIAVSTISYWLLSGYSKVIVSNKLGYEMNGIFAIATKLASMIVVIVSVFQMSWHETSFETAKDKNKREFYEKGINLFYIVLMLAAIAIIPIVKSIFPYMVRGEYVGAYSIIPIVLVYSAINSFAGFSSSQFLAEKNSKATLWTTLASAVLNVILGYVFTIKFGLLGTTIALLISFTLNAVLRVILLNKLYSIKLNMKNVVILTLLLLISILLYYFAVDVINLIYVVVIIVLICVLYRKQIKGICVNFLKKIKEK